MQTCFFEEKNIVTILTVQLIMLKTLILFELNFLNILSEYSKMFRKF